MNQFTAEQIQERFDRLPDVIKESISSPEIQQKIMAIGSKYGLMIDEIGELVDQVGLVMLGLAHASNFVNDTSERLSISHEQSKNIAEEINSQVFNGIKAAMQNNINKRVEDSPRNNPNLSPLERAGDFIIEHEHDKPGIYNFEPRMSEETRPIATPTTPKPSFSTPAPMPPTAPVFPKPQATPMQPSTSTPTSIPTPPIQPTPPTPTTPTNLGVPVYKKESLVEQLMRGPSAIPAEKIIQTQPQPQIHNPIETTPTANQNIKIEPPRNLPTIDPYREPPQTT